MDKSCESPIPVIDIFAGPGGLGEGFSSWRGKRGERFDVKLSIEKDSYAHETLELRTFFREFLSHGMQIPDDYYDFLRQKMTKDELFAHHPIQVDSARKKAWLAELGSTEIPHEMVFDRIAAALSGEDRFVLIGGPPCQAYSLVGRSRNRGVKDYIPEEDLRQKLYVEYLQILADHQPVVFVMENVKGLLSAKINGESVFSRILDDLKMPALAIRRESRPLSKRKHFGYNLFALAKQTEPSSVNPGDFLVSTERYGIPQARHRIIILGIRDDLDILPKTLSTIEERPIWHVLKGMPRIRSGLSRGFEDTNEAWKDALRRTLSAIGDGRRLNEAQKKVWQEIKTKLQALHAPRNKCGGLFLEGEKKATGKEIPRWVRDNIMDRRIGGYCNHESRLHIPEDLHRYMYAACHAAIAGVSPNLYDFPLSLLPNHNNVKILSEGNGDKNPDVKFADRFRVQPWSRPCTTITSHISKDGHYYIHPDASQCRSLTVREAARVQTFPDNYFFCGPRTAQYHQVGNAVPPLLAKQIAAIVFDIIQRIE